MSLNDRLHKISRNVREQHQLLLRADEGAAIRASVLPFIEALEFDPKSLAEVRSEVTADARSTGRRKVDYEIYRGEKPILIIEAKPAHKPLLENEWDQLKGYYNDKPEFKFGILTNGLEFRFYTDLKQHNLMDKEPFMTLDMLNLDARLVNELRWFTKSDYDPEQILSSAQKLAISRVLSQEFNQPSRDLVKHFAGQVHSSRLSESDIQRYARLVKQAWRDFVESEIASRLQASEIKESLASIQQVEKQTQAAGQDQFSDIAQGMQVRVPIKIDYSPRGSKQRHKLRGTLLLADNIGRHQNIIEYDGELLSPSEAAGRAIRSVKPGVANPNGWVYWTFVNPNTGEDDSIDLLTKDEDLRRQILRQR